MRRIVTILEETVEVTLQPNSSSETENATPSSSNSFQELRGNFFFCQSLHRCSVNKAIDGKSFLLTFGQHFFY